MERTNWWRDGVRPWQRRAPDCEPHKTGNNVRLWRIYFGSVNTHMQVIRGHNQKLLLLPPLDSFIQLAMLIQSKTQPGMPKPLNLSVKSIVVICRRASLQFSSLEFQILLLYANKAANPFYLTGIYEFNKRLVYICGSSPRSISHLWHLPIDSVLKYSSKWINFTFPQNLLWSNLSFADVWKKVYLFWQEGAAPTQQIRRYSPTMTLITFRKQPQKFFGSWNGRKGRTPGG